MSLQTLSYTRELEYVIRDILLPVYDKHYRDRGELPPYTQFPPGILKDVCKPPRVCALFKPKNSILT
jgi:hypothetical protein